MLFDMRKKENARHSRKYPDLLAGEIQAIHDKADATIAEGRDLRNPESYRRTLIRRWLVRGSVEARRVKNADREWDRNRRDLTEYREAAAVRTDEHFIVTPEEEAIAVEFVRWIESRYATLDENQRVLLDSYVSGKSMKEVGAELGISPQAAQARSYRIRRLLCAEWREHRDG